MKRTDDFLARLAVQVSDLIETGFYDVRSERFHKPVSLAQIIVRSRRTLITELKFNSPSQGEIRSKESEDKVNEQISSLVVQMESGGSSCISVLTQPLYFGGSLDVFRTVRANTKLPLLMKDIVIDRQQIDAGSGLGADLILLIWKLFSGRINALEELIQHAHSVNLEVLLEVNSVEEYTKAINTDADIIGINNRDLGSLDLDLNTTRMIISSGIKSPKPLVSESGFLSRNQIEEIAQLGVRAFLVGTSIMKSDDIRTKVRELLGTI